MIHIEIYQIGTILSYFLIEEECYNKVFLKHFTKKT
jgi:hypothetical protein